MKTEMAELITSLALKTRPKALDTVVDIKIEESKVGNLLNDCDMHSIPIKQEELCIEHKNTVASKEEEIRILSQPYCSYCKLILLSPSLYTVHMKEKHNLDPISSDPFCHLCDRKYSSRREFREYLRIVHEMTFPYLRSKHNPNIQPEPSDLNFYCKSCDRKSKNISVYRHHLQYVHKMNLPPLKVESDQILIFSLIQNEPKFFCESCNCGYPKKGIYFQHLRGVHKMDISRRNKRKVNLDIEPDFDDPNFYCKSCKTSYLNNKKFRKHLRGVHQLDLPLLKPKPNHDIQPDRNDPEFYCKSYSNYYLNKYKFLQHLWNVHTSKKP